MKVKIQVEMKIKIEIEIHIKLKACWLGTYNKRQRRSEVMVEY